MSCGVLLRLRMRCRLGMSRRTLSRRLGEEIGPISDGYYPGDYLKPVGAALAAEYGHDLLNWPRLAWRPSSTLSGYGWLARFWAAGCSPRPST